jgi:hypothetical protein
MTAADIFSTDPPADIRQIARIFCQSPILRQYHPVFLSCNESALLHPGDVTKCTSEVLQLRDSWCCKCAKCCFVWLLMSAWLDPDDMVAVGLEKGIFPVSLFERIELLPVFQSLVIGEVVHGDKKIKPFECVGTAEEALLCMKLSLYRYLRRIMRTLTGDITAQALSILPICLRSLVESLQIDFNEVLENCSDLEYPAKLCGRLPSLC